MVMQTPQPNLLDGSRPTGLSWRFWALTVMTGIGAGIAGGLLMLLLRAVQHLAWSYRAGEFLDAVEKADWHRRIAVVVAAGLIAGVVRWLLKHDPGGHGGELAEAIWFRSGRIPPLRTTIRAIVSIVVVAMGASLGREAAPKQAGALIASLLCDWQCFTSAERRLLAACGAGAGIAAVYNVPFGGALFALEVLLGTLALPVVAPALTASLIATGVSWLMLPDRPTYAVPDYRFWAPQLAWAALAGPIAGLAAGLYIRAIAWADSRKPNGWPMLVGPVLVFALLGGLALPYPQLLGNGKDVVQLGFTDRLDLVLLLPLFVLKPVMTCLCLGSGAPGGLFTPTLTTGALLGGALGRLWTAVWPGGTPGSYAMIGGAALLAAATQGPVSAIVLMLDLTRHIDAMMVPLMLAVAGAVVTVRLIEPRSIYSSRIHSGQVAARAPHGVSKTRLGAMVSADYAVISAAAVYTEVLHRMLDADQRNMPLYVVDETGKLVGAITLSRARTPRLPAALLAITTAADLARPIAPLTATTEKTEAETRLKTAEGGALPVIDPDTGRLVGIARR